MSPVSRANAEHYAWGQGCDGWHLLKHDGLSVIEERMPSGTAEVRHYHLQARQFFYVLAGQAELEVEGVTSVLDAGEGLHVAPGQAHRMRNHSNTDIRFLVISSPRAHGDRVPAPLTDPETDR